MFSSHLSAPSSFALSLSLCLSPFLSDEKLTCISSSITNLTLLAVDDLENVEIIGMFASIVDRFSVLEY